MEGGADEGMRGSEGNGQQGLGRIPCRGIEIRGGSSMEGQQEIMRRVGMVSRTRAMEPRAGLVFGAVRGYD